jgi:hypothetical protein
LKVVGALCMIIIFKPIIVMNTVEIL